MKNNDQAFLGQEKLGRLMGKYSVPCVISLLVAALYNIVDQIFIANAAYLGSDGNAVTLFTLNGAEPWPRQSKTEVARKLARRIADHFKA